MTDDHKVVNRRPGRSVNSDCFYKKVPNVYISANICKTTGYNCENSYSAAGKGHVPVASLTRVLPQSLAGSSTLSVYAGILGVCLRFKPHWMFQIYLRIAKK